MRFQIPVIQLIILQFACCLTALGADSDCNALLQKSLESDLALSYEQFDQTQGQGFRYLSGLGCHEEAADLIESYIKANNASQSSLVWHIAQLRAMYGDYATAVDYGKKSLRDDEDFSQQPLRWNNYVLAVIAFLQDDKKQLEYHRAQVAEGVDDYFGNEMNLKVLDMLVANFGQPYAEAVSK